VVRTIPVDAVHDYLTRRGWVQRPSSRPTSRYYEHPGLPLDSGKPAYYYFPASNHFIDYPLRVLDFIEAQARLQDVHPDTIFRELLGEATPPAATSTRSVG
jgi:hypothetical protein